MRRSKRDDDELEINLTPMLDVVFIMLIFFIVTASFVKEAGVDVKKASAKTAETKTRATIFVAITADDQIWIDRRPVDIRAVGSNISRMLAENPMASMVIQADVASKNGLLVQVLDAAKLAGVEDVSLAAQQEL